MDFDRRHHHGHDTRHLFLTRRQVGVVAKLCARRAELIGRCEQPRPILATTHEHPDLVEGALMTSITVDRRPTLETPEIDEALDAAPVSPLLGTGSAVRVHAPQNDLDWLARISYVSGEIFGLRGSADAEMLFAPRDVVSLVIGQQNLMMETQGRVLAA